LIPERRHQASQQILQPVTWGHVLGPYFLVAVLGLAFIGHQVQVWGNDPVGSMIGFGILTTMVLVLVRQVAMIAEQRHKVAVDQSGVIATISHELRTPLTTVVGFLDLLEDWERFSDDEKIEMVSLMRDQSHVLARVVGDLVDVAREKIDHIDLDLTCFRVREFLDSVIERVPELGAVELRLDVAPGAVLTADRTRMEQMVSNYLSNAARYGGAEVEVVAYATSDGTIIEVHDDGPGVPDIYHRVIWDRFERGAHRQGAIPGAGIGLSLVRGLAASHGGEAAYRISESLGGACFTVRIPIVREVVEREAALSEATATWSSGQVLRSPG
jgi:signal transduction histidine kinase